MSDTNTNLQQNNISAQPFNASPQQNNTNPAQGGLNTSSATDSGASQNEGIFGSFNLNQTQENKTDNVVVENQKVSSDQNPQTTENNIQKEKANEIEELKNFGVDVLDEEKRHSESNFFSAKKETPKKSFFDKPIVIGENNNAQDSSGSGSLTENSKEKEEIQNPVDTKDLEKDFSDTFTSIESHEEHVGSLESEERRLKDLHQKLTKKAEDKKHLVKQKLEQLKKEKEMLGKELEAIKELEQTASQIEEKLQTIHQIDTELDSIEDRARQELDQ